MLRRLLLCAILSAIPVAGARGAEPLRGFVNVGIGGGGAMFMPACSPHDHNLMFVACDMGGVYRSTNGGTSWKMLDKRQLRGAISLPIQFDPTDPNTLYAVGRNQLVVSHDKGQTFTPVIKDPPWKSESMTAVTVSPLAGTDLLVAAGTSIYQTADSGKTWASLPGTRGRVLKILVTAPSGMSVLFAGTSDGVFRSDDNGQKWQDASQGLPWRELRGFCGGADKTGRTVLYCTIPSKAVEGKLAGGVFRSLDGGRSWQTAMRPGLNLDLGRQDPYGADEIPQYHSVSLAETHPDVVYVTTRGTGSQPPHHFTVYRSDDAGDSWRSCFTFGENVERGWVPIDLNPGFGGPALTFNVCPTNPDIAMYTNHAELYVTRDGGRSWKNSYTSRVAGQGELDRGQAWTTRGLEVTTCWQVAFDPHESQRAYICYTDIGFARSVDRGQSWKYSGRGSPWRNTWYEIAFDLERPGVIYAACSNHHDIPNYKELDPARQGERRRLGGGVCVSEDFGESWRPISKGLPEGSATSIVLDPKSNPRSRTLYVAMFGFGVFKSTDSGATWKNVSEGLGTEENRHIYAVKRHADGTLFCTITGKRAGNVFAEGGGLFRSRDQGGHWVRISPPLKWASGIDLHPQDSRIIYLAASTAPRFPQGGLYKTEDGGASWMQVIKEGDLPRELHGFIHGFYVTVNPKKPDTVYFSSVTHGLHLSEDAGSTWREVQGIPFVGVNRITIDPLSEETLWLTTEGGGVWKGPAKGTLK
jgi:photosystem II stability/assembly factor-like uncharacterized protein